MRAVVGILILSPEAKQLAAAPAIQQLQRGAQISGSLAIPAGAALSAQEVAEMLKDDTAEDRARVLAQLLRARK